MILSKARAVGMFEEIQYSHTPDTATGMIRGEKARLP